MVAASGHCLRCCYWFNTCFLVKWIKYLDLAALTCQQYLGICVGLIRFSSYRSVRFGSADLCPH